jgi:HupE / UreJ protein
MTLRVLLCLILCLYSQLSVAHKSSDSYLTLSLSELGNKGQWDIALRDLDYAIGLDNDQNGAITWGELRSRREAVTTFALSHLQISSGGLTPCQVNSSDFLVDSHTDGAYAVLQFDFQCPEPVTELEINYSLLYDLDPQHRGLLRVDYQNTTHTAVLSPIHNQQHIKLGEASSGTAFLQYLKEGVWHIWMGYDHILFLISLLLPAVFCRQDRRWQPASAFRPTFMEVLKIVTAFTVAHSITLSLATLNVIALPSRWVESAIAGSVIAAACNNLYPVIIKRLWLVAFVFGLIHGLGFANVLKDLGLPQNMLILTLLAFNLGVEIGQLAIVSVFLPTAYLTRKTWWYRLVCFHFGSFLIIVLASIWLLERSLNIKLLGN